MAIAERDLLKAKSEAQLEVIASKDAQINALKGLLDIQKLISQNWQEAATARKSALEIDSKLIRNYDQQIIELRNERDTARRNNKLFGVVGLAAGIGLALFAKGGK